jgi:L-ascorbate metabolism protein UlaG (beta-lactamase superfamily)
MKITKYVHSCLLVESKDKVAIFDPGSFSYPEFDVTPLNKLDHIFITHIHGDHYYVPFVKDLLSKFPDATITAPDEAVEALSKEGIEASSEPIEGVTYFDAPHEDVSPLFPQPEELGIHYLDTLSFPGDSHSFTETKEILALPITAPWGATIKAIHIALELKPKFIVPIHDWHWSDAARLSMYDTIEKVLSREGITMYKPETGKTIEIPIDI